MEADLFAWDISYYNNLPPAVWDLLPTRIQAIFIRMTYGITLDSLSEYSVNQAKRVKLPFAGYHWVDPTRDINQQVQLILSQIARFKPSSYVADIEQWWSRWDMYLQAIKDGNWQPAIDTKFSPAALDSYYKKFMDALRKASPIPIGTYSADWFVNGYSPQLAKWIYAQPGYWEARYLNYYDPAWWGNFKAQYPQGIPLQAMDAVRDHVRIERGVMRQFISLAPIKEPGIPDHQDWNLISREGFSYYFPKDDSPVYLPPVPLPTTPDTTKFKLLETSWVRESASDYGSKVGYQWKDAIVSVDDQENGWYHIIANPNNSGSTGKAGWIYGSYLMPVALDKAVFVQAEAKGLTTMHIV